MVSKHSIRKRRSEFLGQCFRATEEAAKEDIETPIRLCFFNEDAAKAWKQSWEPAPHRSPPEGGWDWPLVYERNRGSVDEYCFAIWADDTILSGIGLIRLAGTATRLEAVEGNPCADDPLKGRVLPIAIDLVERFAKLICKNEVWLVDPSEGLIDTYIEVYEYELAKAPNGKRICRRKV